MLRRKILKRWNGGYDERIPAGTDNRMSPTEQVTVQGSRARRDGNRFSADVVLREKETSIAVVSEGPSGRAEQNFAWEVRGREAGPGAG